MKLNYLFVAGLMLATSCGSSDQETNQPTESKEEALDFMVAGTSDHTESLQLTGKVVTNPNETFVYKPLSDGILTGCFFSVGDYVKAGQKLLTVKSAAFYELQTEIEESQGALRLAQRELDRAKQMYEDGLLAEQDCMQAQVVFDNEQAKLERLQATARMYGRAVGRGIYQVNAQSDGYVFSKNANMTSTITPEDEVYKLSPINHLLILADVYATSIQDVSVGQQVDITSPSYPDSVFHGEIVKLYPYLDEEEKVMKAQIEFDNTHLKLKPDFMVDVKVHNKELENKICIPSDCFVFDNNQFYVLLKKDGKLQKQEVRLSRQTRNYAIVESGVEVGDSVLANKQLFYYSQLK